MNRKIRIVPTLILVLGVLCITLYRPHATIEIDKKHHLNVEIAKTQREKIFGLMFRKNIAENQGMLFIYSNFSLHSIWMKNTLIPLDIIWLDPEKKVVFFLDNVPICKSQPCPSYAPPADIKSQYVLELASGVRQKLNIQKGQRLNF
jgi:uncharacterized membrane protein (UPF0127 family)